MSRGGKTSGAVGVALAVVALLAVGAARSAGEEVATPAAGNPTAPGGAAAVVTAAATAPSGPTRPPVTTTAVPASAAPPTSDTAPPVPVDAPTPTSVAGPPVPADTAPASPVTTTERPAPERVRQVEVPDLRVTLSFAKTSYDIHESAVIRLSVVNAGTGTATRVALSTSGPLSPSWAGNLFPGAALAPGQVVTDTGTVPLIQLTDDGPLTLTATVSADEADADEADNTASATTLVTLVRAPLSGVVYGDADRDSTFEPGEELVGVAVRAAGGTPNRTYETTSGAGGGFTFDELAVGSYWVSARTSTGWRFAGVPARVAPGGDLIISLPGVRPLAEDLSATMAFQPGEAPAGLATPLVVTLTNRGPALTGLVAHCDDSGTSGTRWDALGRNGGGVTVPERSEVRVEVLVGIPVTAPVGGVFTVSCTFDNFYSRPDAVPATASVRVLPGVAELSGSVYATSPGDLCRMSSQCIYLRGGSPGVRVLLRERSTGRVVARTTSTTWGTYTFPPLPPGDYLIDAEGGWRVQVFEQAIRLVVGYNSLRLWVVSASYLITPSSPTGATAVSSTTAPAPAAARAPLPSGSTAGLARTGASTAPALLGAVMVLTGACLIRLSRRCRPPTGGCPAREGVTTRCWRRG
ncbi:hypothetical protein [Actinokineospora globicatena]|uniref:hypothetical protein n=1 Tax=Actinokineospora globicatena TaxID=103729 RepID=UPI0020A320FE|nr:hypothetical protein [Actinokineospora globicatena]MCP2306154.1 hypothetical protein [Actinokineospora globicatena]GLW79972.1 hypothetical protein Aglo01_44530 [Actinokineospora globicatena]GLW86801.1 hypothetical protein Aglo02_44400 [Actinokineospora globicatena]